MVRVLLLLVLLGVLAGCVQDAGVSGRVERVVDGDTVEVALDNGTVWTVRLIGVDTPEVHVAVAAEQYGFPSTEPVEACLRAVGDNASRFVAEDVAGERVVLSFDPGVGRRGEYGRVLAYLHHGNGVVNRALVDQGLARVYPSSFRYRAAFERVEAAAMEQGLGVWGCG